MKRLFNVLTGIIGKVPIFFNFDNPSFYPAWTGYYNYLEENLHWRWVSNTDNLFSSSKFIEEATYAVFKPNNFFNYIGTWPIIIHEHGATHQSDVGYYYYYLSKNGIPLSNFKNVYNRNGNWWNLLNFMIDLLKRGNEEVETEYDKYTRDPRSGYTSQGGDAIYKPEFNMGYEWRYGEVNIEYIGTRNQIEIIGKKEEIFNRDNSGIIRYNGNFYPSKFDMPDKETQDGFLFKVDILLNGKYWLKRILPHVTPPYYQWKDGSYCYEYASTIVNIYKDGTGWHAHFPPFTISKHNVGTNWDGKLSPIPGPGGEPVYVPYEVTDIPRKRLIKEFYDEEMNRE